MAPLSLDTSAVTGMMTPPTSPSAAGCPPSLKRKRDDCLDTEITRLDLHSRNKRRFFASQRQRALDGRHDHNNRWCLSQGRPLPMLELMGAPSVPSLGMDGAPPRVTLKPRVHSYNQQEEGSHSLGLDVFEEEDSEDAVLQEDVQDAMLQEDVRDENVPPAVAVAEAACDAALAISAGDIPAPAAKDIYSDTLASPPPKSQHLRRSSSTGSGCGGLLEGTPLGQLARSISKRSFGSRRESFGSINECETPADSASRTTNTLIQSLESLCLPELEDGLALNEPAAAAARLQQKRPPSTPGQQRALSTFDYLATALRLPDMSGGSQM